MSPSKHLTPTELGRELGIYRREVINLAMEYGVPIFQGRIDRDLFMAAKLDVEAKGAPSPKGHAYIAGAMSGLPEHGFPLFRSAAKALRADGWTITSPAEIDEADGFDAETEPDVSPGSRAWAAFLSRDIKIVADPSIDAVIVLPGWERSRGANLEVRVARELGKRILSYPTLEPVALRPLEKAMALVHGNRGRDYGHPAEDFARTAGMWSALFGWNVQPRDVALAMVCVKLSRLRQTPDHADSPIDVAGYAEAYWMVIEREAQEVADAGAFS